MNHSITFKKFAVILAGLTLSATATIGHAQQQEMEEMLERTLQEQQVAGETVNKDATGQNKKEADNSEGSAPEAFDLSNIQDEDGNPLI